ncbi:TetR/AcrR family transcriptional regulator [Antrihabitans cavernicola]|uniref:TetR/AcrR family transcriptional regulator n=1 Tax=Antrihabitans cavernicola TaxID=2495913 RepID=A0A5A7SID8_9NOCA|nr:TetR/AcrR family transcriptional regulator [Spelaeibacter cavernicola]KAA0024497.1 TetR/AcrR family transcriptional regulator [Spelaeibacter cavernicola]
MDTAIAGTRTRLLDAAEQLLLDAEYDKVSVRAICTQAEANAAAVHYHFGSKDALVAALLEDRLAPLWAQRLDEPTERRSIASYVDDVIAPFTELASNPVGAVHLSLLARLVLGGRHGDGNSRWFRMESWSHLLTAHIPRLDDKSARRRWALAFELILLQFGDRVVSDDATAALRSFVVAGLTAPVA